MDVIKMEQLNWKNSKSVYEEKKKGNSNSQFHIKNLF